MISSLPPPPRPARKGPRTPLGSLFRATGLALVALIACACSRKPAPNEGETASERASPASPSPPKTATGATAAPGVPGPGAAPGSLERARALAHELIIVDGHVDLPYRLHAGRENGKVTEDVRQRTAEGDFDHPRAREGGLDAPFMSIYVPSRYEESGGAKALADELIDSVEAIATGAPELFAIARSPADVRSNFKAGKISLPMGIENGSAFEKKLDSVRHFRDRGVSYVTLTHAKDNAICDSSYDESHTHRGLSAFGKKLIVELNRVGIMIDVSHVSDEAFFQAIELSRVPVIASHSSLRHFVPGFRRNVSDEMLKALADAGGVIMINFGSTFLTAKSNETGDAQQAAARAFAEKNGLDRNDEADRKKIQEHAAAAAPLTYARVEDVADHIDRVKSLVGVEHVGLGSDFDGVGDSLPIGLKDASDYPNLLRELLRRGYTKAELEKICSGNLFRVWQAVLDHAARG